MIDFIIKMNFDVIAIIFFIAVAIILPKITFGKKSLEKRRARDEYRDFKSPT